MIVSMPPRDRNQNSPMNWNITKKNAERRAAARTGRAATSRAGASMMPSHDGVGVEDAAEERAEHQQEEQDLNARPARYRV